MKRLFTFGCSFTQWNWPTWADILGKNYDSHENWGISGIGNRAISQRVSECVLRNQITDQDTIIIQWTDYHRFDQHIKDLFPESSWRLGGSLHVKSTEIEYIRDTWHEGSYIYESLNTIHLTRTLLKSLPCKFYMVSRTDMGVDLSLHPELDFYQPVLDYPEWTGEPIQLFVDELGYKGKSMMIKDAAMFGIPISRPVLDLHPLPSHYLLWLQQTFPVEQFDLEFVEHSDKVLTEINHYDQFDRSYEKSMDWGIKDRYVKGY
jgi:hypothetical protein